jgi:hypothetical protein
MNACAICRRPLSDAASRRRGLGPECWTSILEKVHQSQSREAPLGPFVGNVILVRVDGKPYANVPFRFKPLHCEDHAEAMSWGFPNMAATTLALNILSQFLPPYHVDKVGDLPSPEADVLAPHFAERFLFSAPYAGCIILQRDILRWLGAMDVPAAGIRTFGVLA